ncbi:hypothetical protein CFC21_081843 [Triticum aestivum]|uniref:DUF3456 domain-containing protein n=3 Tax=Triticum aestivum TaxID=4565 RepID=A0A9R1I599_WHEAT|nr:hypothetical protein CFC21_081843 [Triticum aestivum]
MEPRRAIHRRSGALLLLLAAVFAAAAGASASAIGDKCAACKAVASELEIGISSEKPRNHLDLRNRLNSKGQREGKVIDYRVSELRIVELLDDLCDKMQDYTLQKLESGEKEWVKVPSWSSFQTGYWRKLRTRYFLSWMALPFRQYFIDICKDQMTFFSLIW